METLILTEQLCESILPKKQGSFLEVLWLWLSGQRAHLLLRQSEFESHLSQLFFVKIVVEKNENKSKEAGVGPFLVFDTAC